MAALSMRRVVLRHLKNSASSNVQVPASGATVTLYRQGATSSSHVEVFEQDTVTVNVLNLGRIVPGDVVWVSSGPELDFLVVGMSATSLTLEYQGNQPLVIEPGDRIYPVSTLVSYSDSMGANELSSIVTDTNGYAAFYCPESRFDYRLTDAGSASGFFIDIEGGWGRSAPSQINAKDFPSIQDAVDALPPCGGTVFIPAGVYEMESSTLYTPCDRPCHLVGEGRHQDPTKGTVLKWNTADGMLRVRGDYSSVRGLTLWNTYGAGPSREDRGYGIMIGRRDVEDAHPPFGTDPQAVPTEYEAGDSSLPTHSILIEDVAILGAPGWAIYIPGHGNLSDGETSEYDKVYPGPSDGGTLSFWIECKRVYAASSKAYGSLFIGEGCTTTHFVNCAFMGQGPPITGALDVTYYVYLAGCAQPVFERCTFEGLSGTSLPWIKLVGTQDPIFDACWFENRTPLTDTEPSYFVEFNSGCRAGAIRHCRFVRAANNKNKLKLIKLQPNGATGLQILNLGGASIGQNYDPVHNTYVDNHIDLGGTTNKGIVVSGAGCFSSNSIEPTTRSFQVDALSKESSLSGQTFGRLPGAVTHEIDDPGVGDPALHQDANVVMNYDLTDDESGVGVPMFKWGIADELPLWKLINNAPMLTNDQRDNRGRWADGDIILNVTNPAVPVLQIRYDTTWKSITLS